MALQCGTVTIFRPCRKNPRKYSCKDLERIIKLVLRDNSLDAVLSCILEALNLKETVCSRIIGWLTLANLITKIVLGIVSFLAIKGIERFIGLIKFLAFRFPLGLGFWIPGLVILLDILFENVEGYDEALESVKSLVGFLEMLQKACNYKP